MTYYKIIGFNETNGSIIVEFDDNHAPLSIDIPIDENNAYLIGDALDVYIQGFIPTWHLDRLTKIKNGVLNVQDIKNLVQEPPTVNNEISEEQRNEIIRQQEAKENEHFIKVLTRLNILPTN
jgi:hypothetical protein